MDRHRYPRGIWSAAGTVLVAAMIAMPQLVVVLVTPRLHSFEGMTHVAAIAVFVPVLAAAIAAYFHWHLTGADHTAWFATLGGVIGIQGLAGAFLHSTRATGEARPWWLVGSDVGVCLLVLAVAVASRHVAMTTNPALPTLVAGSTASLGLLLVAGATPSTPLPPSATAGVVAFLVLMGAGIAALARRCVAMPVWARHRLALGMFLLVISRASYVAASGRTPLHVATIVAGIWGSTLVLCVVLALVREAVQQERDAASALQSRVTAVVAAAEAAENRLHEVRGTVAGIASACHLIHVADQLPDPRRRVLEGMLDSESARLQRLLGASEDLSGATTGTGEPSDVGLDEVLEPLVLTREVGGHRVDWSPSRLRVWSAPDDLATVVNILLDNAVKHAPGARVDLCAEQVGTEVWIRVTDNGPGLDPAVRGHLYDRGRPGAGSSGSGIGLHMAAELARECGGRLELEGTGPGGTTFLVRVPAARTAVLAPSASA